MGPPQLNTDIENAHSEATSGRVEGKRMNLPYCHTVSIKEQPRVQCRKLQSNRQKYAHSQHNALHSNATNDMMKVSAHHCRL